MAASSTKKFPVKQRKELGTHLSEVLKDRSLEIAQQSINQVKDSVHGACVIIVSRDIHCKTKNSNTQSDRYLA